VLSHRTLRRTRSGDQPPEVSTWITGLPSSGKSTITRALVVTGWHLVAWTRPYSSPTPSGRRFPAETVRAVAARGHALRRGALVGAGVFAVLGAVTICSDRSGDECGIIGALAAAPIGAGVGLAIGALIPQMRPIYRAPENPVPMPLSHAAGGVQASLLEDLALHVNLDDRLRVEDRSGRMLTGRLTHLTDDDITIQTDVGEERFRRETVRQVAVRRHPLRVAVLAGTAAGAVTGAVPACTGSEREECADAAILAGALGAGLGLVAGALMHTTTIVYPEPEKRTQIVPVISGNAVGVRITRRW
jgi:hypothetical protein